MKRDGIFSRVRIFTSGFIVGAADLVPGISGGTLAFIIDIYEELLTSIATFNKKNFSLLFKGKISLFFREVSWKFLLFFLVGQVTSFVLLAKGFKYLLNHEPHRTYLYATMMGLVLGSVSFCFKKIEKSKKSFVFFLVGVVVAFWVAKVDFKAKEPLFDIPMSSVIEEKNVKNVDFLNHTIKNVPQSKILELVSKKYLNENSIIERTHDGNVMAASEVTGKSNVLDIHIVAVGVFAACAMLLPGISGSYLLTVLGMYSVVLGAFVEFIEALKSGIFDIHAFRIVLSISAGMCLGAISFSHVINFLLRKYRTNTLSVLIGFMIGSLRAVYPFYRSWYEYLPLSSGDSISLKLGDAYIPNIGSLEFTYVIIFLLGGFILVNRIEIYANKLRQI